jgi:hypothetical protein
MGHIEPFPKPGWLWERLCFKGNYPKTIKKEIILAVFTIFLYSCLIIFRIEAIIFHDYANLCP